MKVKFDIVLDDTGKPKASNVVIDPDAKPTTTEWSTSGALEEIKEKGEKGGWVGPWAKYFLYPLMDADKGKDAKGKGGKVWEGKGSWGKDWGGKESWGKGWGGSWDGGWGG